MSRSNDVLLEVLARAQKVGFLGPGAVESHIEHADRFAVGLTGNRIRLLDIGSGGGVPALPLLVSNNIVEATLVDTSQRRCSFLVWALCELGLEDIVNVECARAEELAHQEKFRGAYSCVTARSFGPPAWTLECALGFLEPGARFVVSEPPGSRRWPSDDGLADLGLKEIGPFDGVACFERVGSLPVGLPRRAKKAVAEPLFTLG